MAREEGISDVFLTLQGIQDRFQEGLHYSGFAKFAIPRSYRIRVILRGRTKKLNWKHIRSSKNMYLEPTSAAKAIPYAHNTPCYTIGEETALMIDVHRLGGMVVS
jgi:hypothetical protein